MSALDDLLSRQLELFSALKRTPYQSEGLPKAMLADLVRQFTKARAELADLRAEVERLKARLHDVGVDESTALNERDAARAEVERMRGLVRSAYLEGWREGNSVSVFDSELTEEDWLASDSRSALEAKP